MFGTALGCLLGMFPLLFFPDGTTDDKTANELNKLESEKPWFPYDMTHPDSFIYVFIHDTTLDFAPMYTWMACYWWLSKLRTRSPHLKVHSDWLPLRGGWLHVRSHGHQMDLPLLITCTLVTALTRGGQDLPKWAPPIGETKPTKPSWKKRLLEWGPQRWCCRQPWPPPVFVYLQLKRAMSRIRRW